MATTRKTQMEKIENVLRKHGAAGITTKKIASLTRVSRESVGKRIYDLRERYTINTDYRVVGGKRTAFYRFAG